MRAQIKNYFSPDIDLRTFWPEDEESFNFLLSLSIGIEGEDSAANFDVQVISFKSLNEDFEDFLFGRHRIFLKTYDIKLLISKIERYVESCSGSSWDEIAIKLSKFAKYEYDEY